MIRRLTRWMILPCLLGLIPCPSFALTITAIQPADYQIAALAAGSSIYTDGPGTVGSIPLVLNGGTLIRTRSADGSDSGLAVHFTVDQRAEVYVCTDSRNAPPTWLSTWVNTGMTVGVTNGPASQYNVYARRFPAGTVNLSANAAAAMYFIVVQASVPVIPRNGWVLLSYDMPYLREIIKQAPFYHVNHIEFSHDIIMMPTEVLDQPARRNDVNELIDLAHAYGITEVSLWVHELCTIDMPSVYRAPAPDNRPDGNNPSLWTWLYQRYVALFSAGTGCPEVDSIVLTYSELSQGGQGVEVYDRTLFKHDNNTPTQSEAKVINTLQQACAAYGKTLFARTWAGGNQSTIRDAVIQNADPAVWMMTKCVGANDPTLYDWQFMDTYNPYLGTLPAGYKEAIEFDLCGEYLGRGRYTYVMTSYLKDHWNNFLARSAGASGLVSRIDRQGSLPFYSSNRLNLYAQREIMANPNVDPQAVNLAWAQQNFPAEAAQDVANSYDAPGSAWDGDTRYMTWEAFTSLIGDLSPTTTAQAQTIATTAIAAIDRHRAQLEAQTVLDTRDGKNDYETLRNGLALAYLDLGGILPVTLPTAYGFSNVRPMVSNSTTPNCLIDIHIPWPGLKVSSVTCEYSVDGGASWTSWPASSTGANGSVNTETVTAGAVPFNQLSEVSNQVRFTAQDMNNVFYTSGALRVIGATAPSWGTFNPMPGTSDLTPDCSIAMNAAGISLDVASVGYSYSVDGGSTWSVPPVSWQTQYECNQKPLLATPPWTLVEGSESNVAVSVSAGIVHIRDTSTAGNTKVKYARSWTVSPNVGATVIARMQCVSGGHFFGNNLFVADALHSEFLYLKANGMIGLYGYNALVPVNTGTYHTYRMTIRNTDLNVYYDENPKPIIRANGAFVQQPSSYAQLLQIGSGSSAGTQDIYYDYVYWTTAGAFAPGQWWPVNYSGNSQVGTLTAPAVPFNQASNTLNKIRFRFNDTLGQVHDSPIYTVRTGGPWADFDSDGDVDMDDFAHMQVCFLDDADPYSSGCADADADQDGDVDSLDFDLLLNCVGGPNVKPSCAN